MSESKTIVYCFSICTLLKHYSPSSNKNVLELVPFHVQRGNQPLTSLSKNKRSLILGLNKRYLNYHEDDLKVLLEPLENKQDILALTENLMNGNEDRHTYSLKDYQLIEITTRKKL